MTLAVGQAALGRRIAALIAAVRDRRPAARLDRRPASFAHDPADRLAAFGRHRRLQPQLAAARLHLGDPAAPQHDESLAAEKIVGAAFDDPRQRRVAAVVDLIEDRPVGLAQIDGHEHPKSAENSTLPAAFLRRELQIDDLLVGRVRRIEGKMHDAGPLLVRARVAPRLPAGIGLALGDFPADDFGGDDAGDAKPTSDSNTRKASTTNMGGLPKSARGTCAERVQAANQ